MEKLRRYALLLPALLALVAYGSMVRGGFTGDDFTVQVWHVPAIKNAGDAFTSPAYISSLSDYYYRPLVYLTYHVEDKAQSLLSGTPPPPLGSPERLAPARAALPHAFNIIGHALASSLLALLAFRLLKGRPGALPGAVGAGLLFALHPMQSLVVCPITGLSDLLATTFLLSATLLGIRARDTGKPGYLAAAFLAMLAAIFSKEVAIAGVLLAPLCVWFTRGEEESSGSVYFQPFGQAVIFMAALLVYIILRNASGVKDAVELLIPGSASDLGALFGALGFYLRSLALPWPVRVYTPGFGGVAPTLVTLALFGAALAGLAFAERSTRRLGYFCVALLLLSILPSLPVSWAKINETPVAGRYLYLPMVGFSLLFGAALTSGPVQRIDRRALAGILAVAALAGGVVAHGRTVVWHSALSLWTAETSDPVGAAHARPWIHLGHAQKLEGNPELARESYLKALDPATTSTAEDRALAQNNLGVLALDQARELVVAGDIATALPILREAIGRYEKAVSENPGEWLYAANFGSATTKEADLLRAINGVTRKDILERAARSLRAAEVMSPGNPAVLAAIAEWKAVASDVTR